MTDQLDSLREEMVMDEFIRDLKDYNRPRPRIHVAYKFTDIESRTRIEVFDGFAIIQERVQLDDGEEAMAIVALARSLNENDLSNGSIQIIDVRIMNDTEPFTEAATLFLNKRDNYLAGEDVPTQEQGGQPDTDHMVNLITSTWKFGQEMEGVVFH